MSKQAGRQAGRQATKEVLVQGQVMTSKISVRKRTCHRHGSASASRLLAPHAHVGRQFVVDGEGQGRIIDGKEHGPGDVVLEIRPYGACGYDLRRGCDGESQSEAEGRWD